MNVVARFACIITVALMALGCPPERPDRAASVEIRTGVGESPVAKVGSEEITLREYRERIDRLPEYVRPRLATVESRIQHLDALVDFELLADEAEREGYGDDPRVIHAVKEALAAEAVAGEDRDDVLAEVRANADVKIDVADVKKALEENE